MLRNVSIRRKGLLVLALPLVTATAVLAILYGIGRSLDRAMLWTLHSQDVLSKIEMVTSELNVIHGENLQLALLGTSETVFEIRERVDAVGEALQQLRAMVADNPRQAAAVAEFVPKAEQLLLDLAGTHAVLRGGKVGEGAALSAVNDRVLKNATQLADELRREERRIGLERLEEAGQISEQSRIALVAGGLSIVLLVVVLGWQLMRSMLWRLLVVQANVRRLASDEELQQPIPAQDEIGQIDLAVHDMVRALRAQRRDNEMFIYSVSHDLRSPLVNLQGFGKELARSAGELGELAGKGLNGGDPSGEKVAARIRQIVKDDMPEALHYIDLAVQRQARIIDSLLSLSRAGRVEYRWTEVDLQDCLKKLADEARSRHGERRAEITVGEVPAVFGDRDALERLFDNLLSNAIKYLSPDRPGRIEIGRESAPSDVVVVFVRDNGVGIAEENLERVFVPFARFSGGQGEGIGLSLVRRVVDRHHGKIWIESRLGVGTTVFVRLRAATTSQANGP